MKFKLLVILLLSLVSAQSVSAQTQADLQVLLSACQFFAGAPLSEGERQIIISDFQESFQKDPVKASQEIQELRQLGASLSQLTNPIELVAIRQQGLYALLQDNASGKATPSTKVVVTRANPLAADPANQIVLLPDDLDGALALLSTVRQMHGGAPLTVAEQSSFRGQAVQGFAGLPAEAKQFLVCGRVLWAIASQRMAHWNQQQQTQFLQQVAPAQSQPMSMDTYQMLSNMSRSQHMTTMNILENMGDSGGHWDLVERPSW